MFARSCYIRSGSDVAKTTPSSKESNTSRARRLTLSQFLQIRPFYIIGLTGVRLGITAKYIIRYDTIEELNVDSKAEYSA